MIQEKFRDYSINVVLIKYIISVDGGNDEESVSDLLCYVLLLEFI